DVPIKRHCRDSLPLQARSNPPVSSTCPVSLKVVATPLMVILTVGNGAWPSGIVFPHPVNPKSLVSKLNSAVWVRMTVEFGAMVKLPQRSAMPLPCASKLLLVVQPGTVTKTSLIWIGELEVLSRRIAPESNVGPAPMNVVFGEPCQGTGKVEFGRRLSA